MVGLNISENCQKEWENTLNVSQYESIDNNLSMSIAEFLRDQNLKNTQKIETELKNIVSSFAKVMGVKINRVAFVYNEQSNMVGGYNDENKMVVFNLSENNLHSITKTEFLQTIIHELRHAQQSQIIKNFPNSELATTVEYNFKNYTAPTGKIIKNAKYFSNFNEVDAEIFSHVYLENILTQLKQNSALREYADIINSAQISHKHSHNEFKHQLEESLKIIDVNNKSIMAIKKGITNYSKLLFSSNGKISKEFLDEQANLLIQQCEEMFNGTGKDLIDFTDNNFFAIQEAMYSSASAVDIVRHLDSPFIKYIEQLEDRFGDLGLGRYNKHTRRLKSILADSKKFLDAHNIKYNENDNGEILSAVIENMPKVYLENLKNPTNKAQMQKDHDLSSAIDVYVTRDKNYLHLECARYAEQQVPEKELRALIENLVDADITGTSDFDMRQDLLNGYAMKYSYEKTWHTREEFLNFVGIKCKNKSFSEIYDKFEEAFPKFLTKCLNKKKLSEQEQRFITDFSLGVYGNININILKTEINNQLFSKAKIKKLIENGEVPNPVIEALLKRKINLIEILSEQSQQQKQ